MPADFSSRLLAPAYPVTHRGYSTADGRGFKRRPRELSGVGLFLGGIGLHGSIARFISSLVYQGRRAAIA